MPARISDQVLEQIRQQNDVVEVIGAYFPLKRAGANFRALCPFHKEKTPSFNVHPQKQIWHCFGCGAGGDVFKFVMQYEGLEFMDAVRRLAERAGVRLEWNEDEARPDRDQKDSLLKLHEQVANFFHQTLLKDKTAEPARAYLKKRRIGDDVAKRWRLGYSPDAWDGLIQWAAGKKFSAGLLEAGGLALRRDQAEGYYDRFRGRLMFPICDEQGRVVGFSGRILTEAKDQPKYVNSPETPIFQKGRILFALDRAKRAILDEKIAVVCEGQVDTISCHEAGLANVVAPQGTALTEQHARILKRYAEEVVLMFDADTAGQNAIVRSADPLWEAGMAIRVAVMPKGHDPDSFVKEFGAEKLKNIVTRAPSFFVFLLERLSQRHNPETDRGKLLIVQQMVEWLVRMPSPILLSTYAQQTAERLGVPEDAVRQELRKLQGRRRAGSSPADDVPVGEESSADDAEPVAALPAEVLLLQLMLADQRVVDAAIERLETAWLTQSVAGRMIKRVLDLCAKGGWSGPNLLLNEVSVDDEGTRLVAELLLKSSASGTVHQAANDCLLALERRWLEEQIKEERKRLTQEGLSATQIVKTQQRVLDLRAKLDNIAQLSGGKPAPSH